MKRLIVLVTAICISSFTYGQFQVSVSTGYSVGSAGMKLGETMSTTETENTYGSYGEGLNFQLRGTYFFNNKFGLDLGLGYLNGSDQTVSEVSVPGTEVDAIARARAFGASASVVYKFNKNVYGRFGALVKVGGKTEAVVYNQATLPDATATALGLPSGSYTETNYVEDYHGHLPLGFVAALGYTYELNENFSLFVEGEYYGISLKRKDSKIQEFNTDVFLPDGTVAMSGLYTLDNLPAGTYQETTYVDTLSNTETDASKKLSQKVPYSSFGINFGLIYKFKNSSSK
ncbi:Outer membrane protein beta-barrel domain-containing protein [Polaribacter sp. KT25b]|uniref:outer membrane beta-barrel protein n=1 Tax=Polaribacter sp. KT25b TaxID=1855336 RepID=UPI00087B2813|nr:outer membrane beta-barrel protein [Polaribacter sp. KT25b]SDR96404.1 Outer membrane protein beta-barrel domain-containing protein [Polaribacter sp. KT25b]